MIKGKSCKSYSKNKEKKGRNKKDDLYKEIGDINEFTIIEKLDEDKKEKKNKEENKNNDLEIKAELIELNQFDEKNKSFFKNWIIYNKPNESRFTQLFKELKVQSNINKMHKEENSENEQYKGNNNGNAFDNISSNPSEENSRNSRVSNYDDIYIIGKDNHGKKKVIEDDSKNKNKDIEKNDATENAVEELKLNVEINEIISQKDKRCTIMIKNIPNKFNQEYILNIINQNFKGTYDVFVLPINKFRNFGYAFINFTSIYYIPYFYYIFNDNMWFGTNSQKVCKLAYSKVQGKAALLEHYTSQILFYNDEAFKVSSEQGYIIPNIYKLYFIDCYPNAKIEEYNHFFITKMPSL